MTLKIPKGLNKNKIKINKKRVYVYSIQNKQITTPNIILKPQQENQQILKFNNKIKKNLS